MLILYHLITLHDCVEDRGVGGVFGLLGFDLTG